MNPIRGTAAGSSRDPVRKPLFRRITDGMRAPGRLARLAGACVLLLATGLILWLFFQPEKPGVTRISAAAPRSGEPARDRSAPLSQRDPMDFTDETAYYGEYYLTPAGTRFHRKDCSFLKSALEDGTARRLTAEDYASGKYIPCSRCLAQFTPETEAP